MLIDLLRQAAGDEPEQPVVRFPETFLSYAECVRRAEALARGLHRRGLARFGCVVDDAGDQLALLAASSAVGSEACVYPRGLEPGSLTEYMSRFDHAAVVTDHDLRLESAQVVALDGLYQREGQLPPPTEVAPVLILTTGTTGNQRGARHDWSRLVAAARHVDPEPGARWLLAYNLNQFAGLQMLLHVLSSRATLVVPPSNRPRDVVAAMRDLGVTHVSATPTFWRLVAGVLDDATARGLPLRQITLGGEPVPEGLLGKLRAMFPAARISQVYGATEFGLALSVRDGRSGLPRTLLDRDEDAEVQVKVVGGELYVRSRVGMLGYYGEPEDEGGWRPTGDLVEVRGDRIHFVGRTSEVINVGGVKVHPVPVEELIASVDGVEMTRAYGRSNPVTGQIVAVDVVADPAADTKRVEAGIRAACGALPRAAQPRRIRFVRQLEIRGRKLVRQATAPER